MIKIKSKNEIIEELYATEFVQKYISQLSNSTDIKLIDDVRGEIWLQICNLKEDRLQKLYRLGGVNKVRAFVAGLIWRQIKSENSAVYKYKKHYLTTVAVADFGEFNGDNKEEIYDE